MDELHPGYLVGLLVLLVACSAFFSCVETALLNLDRYRLRLQAKQGLRGARRSSWLLLHDDRLRGTCCSAAPWSTSAPPPWPVGPRCATGASSAWPSPSPA